MDSDSEYPDKVDALDLIIRALKDHEKTLDEISHHLESVLERLSTTEFKNEKKEDRGEEPSKVKKSPHIICNRWDEFKDICRGTKMAAFELENICFHVYSKVNEEVFEYSENLPPKMIKVSEEEKHFYIDKSSLNNIDLLQFLIDAKLKCGLSLSPKSSKTALPDKKFIFELSYECNSDDIKNFLSRELDISKSSIVEGKING